MFPLHSNFVPQVHEVLNLDSIIVRRVEADFIQQRERKQPVSHVSIAMPKNGAASAADLIAVGPFFRFFLFAATANRY